MTTKKKSPGRVPHQSAICKALFRKWVLNFFSPHVCRQCFDFEPLGWLTFFSLVFDSLSCSKENVRSFFFSTHQETEAANPYAARFPLWSLCDNRVIINHTGWLFTCPLFPLVDRRLSFSSSWASSSRMKNVWKDWISSSCWSFLCSYFTVESLGFMYHTVCSRRLDKDYTSYIPCSRYIGTCVSVEYVYVNIWRFWFFSLLNGSVFEVYTFRDHP